MTQDDLYKKCHAEVWAAGLAGEPYDFSSLKGRLPQEKIDQLKRSYGLAKKTKPSRLPTEDDDRKLFNDEGISGEPGAQLREKAGGGTYGRVYKALEATLRRSVAIKILKAKSSTDRDTYEARLSTKVDSHHVVKVDRIGYLSDGRLYIVMEWIEGEAMNKYCVPGQPLPEETQVLQWMEQCCDGMKSLAQAGIVHRDLKPGNILIKSETKEVKICDMGLAKDLSSEGFSDDEDSTGKDGPPIASQPTGSLGGGGSEQRSNGTVCGTDHFISPQALNGSANEQDDIYSFGATFYQMLTGEKVFKDKEKRDLDKAVQEELPISPRVIKPELSAETEEFIMRCLQIEPTERFQSFEEMFDRLRGMNHGGKLEGSIPAFQKKVLQEFDQRLGSPSQQDQDFTLIVIRNGLELQENHPVYLYHSGRIQQEVGDYDQAIKDLSRSIESVSRGEPIIADAYFHRGLAYFAKEKYETAIDDYTQSIRHEDGKAPTWLHRGLSYLELVEIDHAIDDFSTATKLEPRTKDAWFFRGFAHAGEGRYDAAIGDYDTVLRLDPKDLDALRARGHVHMKKDDYASAIADFNQILNIGPTDNSVRKDLDRAIEAQEQNTTAQIILQRGLNLADAGRHEEAIEDYSLAIERAPRIADTWFYRGISHFELREFSLAIKDYTKAIELDQENAESYYLRGLAYEKQGDKDKAIQDFEEAFRREPDIAD